MSVAIEPEEAFHRAFSSQEFDVYSTVGSWPGESLSRFADLAPIRILDGLRRPDDLYILHAAALEIASARAARADSNARSMPSGSYASSN